MSNDVKNFFLAIGISVLIFLGFNYFYPPAETKPVTPTVTQQPKTIKPVPLTRMTLERSDAIQLSERAFFETHNVKGSINLTTGAIDDLQLKNTKKQQLKTVLR